MARRAYWQYERPDGTLHYYTWSRRWLVGIFASAPSPEEAERVLAARNDALDELDASERRFYGCPPEARERAEKDLGKCDARGDLDAMLSYYSRLASVAEWYEDYPETSGKL